ncbi:MAG TPA: energy transducer TonB, partial [Rhodanobacteraceae bacterium]
SVAVQPVPALIPWLAEPQLKARIAMLARRMPGALRRRVGAAVIVVLLAGGTLAMNGQAAVPAAPATGTVAAAPLLYMMRASHAAHTPPAASTPASVDVSYKNRNPPRYPVEAARDGEQGMVILKVTVNAAGAVSGLAVDPHGTTAPPVLQAAAVRAAVGWKFNPGRKHGEATGGVVTIPVNFSLQGMDGKPYKPRCSASDQYVPQIKQCVKLIQPGSSAR